MHNQECADVCNDLLKGEMSAVETYQHALDKFAGEPQANKLRTMLVDHEESVSALKERVRRMGGEPVEGSGIWGSFAKAVEGTAALFGNKSALMALKQGEEKGANDYEKALENDDVEAECKEIIRRTL
ncbi:MAG: DUF2383 domain-containing protein, partial [Bdellovibrionales bacterium]|nr:DUF2383 domain-containing protein [Bdellovibrionales bacterium]